MENADAKLRRLVKVAQFLNNYRIVFQELNLGGYRVSERSAVRICLESTLEAGTLKVSKA